jgi:superfamily II DNA/RNA helicase
MSAFTEMSLPEDLLRGIFTYGFETPSEVQSRVVPIMRTRRDVLIQSPSGSGKTGTFAIASLSLMRDGPTNALILSPSRELARQTCSIMQSFAAYMPDVSVVPLVGGTPRKENLDGIRKATLCAAVGTPGRTLDILQSSAAFRKTIGLILLDEAVQLIQEPSFQDTIASIFSFLPCDSQVAVFSATFDEKVDSITSKFLRDPFISKVTVPSHLTVTGIAQYVMEDVATNEDRLNAVHSCYKAWSVASSIVFCSSRTRVDWLADQMQSRGFAVSRLHAGYSDAERTETMARFRSGESRVLIATHIVARGIDVQSTQLVILCDMIADKDTYLHAIGRCGRFGRKGVAVILLQGASDAQDLRAIQDHYSIDLKRMPSSLNIEEMKSL